MKRKVFCLFFGIFAVFQPARAGSSAEADGLLGMLIRGESFFSERRQQTYAEGRSLDFLSRGLPVECLNGPDGGEEVRVSVLLSKSELTRLQIASPRPRRFSADCVFALVSLIRGAEVDGVKLIDGNLNRLRPAASLYLEFYLEGPKPLAQVDALFKKWPLSVGLSRTRLWPWVLIVLGLMGTVFGFASNIFSKRGKADVANVG